jgi:hypothetical protein
MSLTWGLKERATSRISRCRAAQQALGGGLEHSRPLAGLEPDLRRIQPMIWPFTTAAANRVISAAPRGAWHDRFRRQAIVPRRPGRRSLSSPGRRAAGYRFGDKALVRIGLDLQCSARALSPSCERAGEHRRGLFISCAPTLDPLVLLSGRAARPSLVQSRDLSSAAGGVARSLSTAGDHAMPPTGTIALAIRSALAARLHWRQSACPNRARSALRHHRFAEKEASDVGVRPPSIGAGGRGS